MERSSTGDRRSIAPTASGYWLRTPQPRRGLGYSASPARDIGRDRPAEFASSGNDAAQLVASIDRTIIEIESALRDLDPARLDVRLVPAQELWGEGPPQEISVRDAILRVIGHASLHLGHMHVTRDLALAQA